MRAELYRPDAPDDVVAVVRWDGATAHLDVKDRSIDDLERIVRAVPVVVEDPSLRSQGTHGPVVLQPGDLAWFRAAVLQRARALGLSARFRADAVVGGWDPAASYRTFDQQVERLTGAEAEPPR